MSNEADALIVQSPVGRVLFEHVFEMQEGYKGRGDPSFNITLAFEKDEDLSGLKTALKTAAKAEWGSNIPEKLRLPFKDGDKENAKRVKKGNKPYDSYEGMILLKAKSKFPVGVVTAKRDDIDKDSGDFYAGCYARIKLKANAYEIDDGEELSCGCNFYLMAVQKGWDGDKLGGTNARDAFDDLDVPDGAIVLDDDPEDVNDIFA